MAKVQDIEVEIKLNAEAEARVRAIAREEVASLCGLVLRRLQDGHDATLVSIFGEALRDFSQTPAEPGPIAE